ncbi:MAG TPA: beta-N-acetylhexosaminidase [Deferrisomatales bacterium]|nr:beta-N-acetylhexosaminidase [Deferrisomatales bacterium]
MRGPDRVGHMLVLGYAGAAPPEELYAFAARFGLGGVILFRRNAGTAAEVTRVLAAFRARLAEVDPGSPALVLVDQEGGRVERLRDGVPSLPPARELAAGGPQAVAAAVGAQARALRRLGIDVNLAPVCDLPRPGASEVIGDRAYAADPACAGACVAAHVAATLAAGVLPCAKHFPGHGAARVDSHAALPVLDLSREEIRTRDLVPFTAAIAAGVPLVMPGHLHVPAVDDAPASLSSRWLQDALRGELGFAGAVVSDDLEMGALDGLGAPPQLAARAVAAGCDLLIYGQNLRPGLAVAAVAEHLEQHLPGALLGRALARVHGLRERLG